MTDAPDLILHRGSFTTLDRANPTASAAAIKDSRFCANHLFSNGYYFTLAGFTGYVNLVHVKPSVTLHPTGDLTILLAVAAQWRETTADAVYVQPNIPIAGTAGKPGRYTGTYGQLRCDWAITSHYSAALEAVHFAIGDALRRAGGHDGNRLGVQLSYGW